MRILLLVFAMAFLFSGCHRAPLSCRSEYLYPEYLASFHVDTPDPCADCYYGQQVVVYWNLPRDCCPDELKLSLRYGTRALDTVCWPIQSPKGHKIYRIINDTYWCNEGIIAYKAEMYRRGEVVAQWCHHLWADVIELKCEQ